MLNTKIEKVGGGSSAAPASKTAEIQLEFSPPATPSELEVEFEAPASAVSLEVEPMPAVAASSSAAVEFKPSTLEVEFEAPDEAPAVTAETTAEEAPPPVRELVPVYMLAMHLPSADLVADDYTEDLGGAVRRVKEWNGDVRRLAREIENMRRTIYRRIERLWCMVREFGVWIAVTEAGVREAEHISKEVKKRLHQLGLGEVANRYFVRAVKVYLEPQDAKMLLDATVRQLTAEVQELERRIKDAEVAQNKRLVKELMYKREYVKHLLMVFKKYIENINS